MNNDGEKKRVGIVRFNGLTWKMNSEMIKMWIGRENIIDIVQPQEDGKDLDAHEIIFIHSDFDEVEVGDPIPFYSYEFSSGELRRLV